MTEVKKQRKRKLQVETEDPKAENMDAISQHLAKLDSRRQDLAKKLDDAGWLFKCDDQYNARRPLP